MTASEIAKQLGVGEIYVDFTLSESLQKYIFEQCPLNDLEIFKIDKAQWDKKYAVGETIQFKMLEDERELRPEYPEDQFDIYARALKVFDNTLNHLK